MDKDKIKKIKTYPTKLRIYLKDGDWDEVDFDQQAGWFAKYEWVCDLKDRKYKYSEYDIKEILNALDMTENGDFFAEEGM